ncbi:hypothetical protein KB553_09000 [Chryseobacterium rhizoplanae]|uniref:hypothetical protein n=1 Tax=Chryseobacterium rhizoplanae TaxID=1609531 RepID=UPI001CE2D2E5|nr:hypothetical protein [Chryseobacterium rhizoplanae]UCA61658.1 hypothetical protein KB553_09000 [Chryseobacterium rhizoplanae]
MPLNKAQLIQRLITMLNKPKTKSNVETAAQELADAIEEFVKSGTVTGVCGGAGSLLTQGKVT